MGRRFDTISFLSDLGLVDETVGLMKAIVRDLAPHVSVVDLTHSIAAYDVRGGSLALARCIGYVPSGVVVAAVDAGSDNGRSHVAIEVAGGEGVLVGPDNGLLAPAVAMAGGAGRAVLLTDPDFHLTSPGAVSVVRDIYAPVAAHLCNGADIADLGEMVDADVLLPGVVPLPREADGGGVSAEVLWVNHLGDCQLNIGLDDVAPWAVDLGQKVQIVAGEIVRVAERVAHGGSLGPGAVGLVVDPSGLLALTLDHRSAAVELAIGGCDQLVLRPLDEGDRGAGTTIPVQLRQR